MKKGLPLKPLQSLCDDFKQNIVDGPFGSELQRKDYITKGVPVLKIQNVKPFAIELKKMDYISPSKFQELRRHSYRRGDIVMTKLGSPLGASAIIEDLDEGVIVADLVRIRAQNINTKYLCYHLNSQRTNDFINSMQKGTTRPRVTLSVVRELPIYVPSPNEQQRIVGILDEAFDGIAIAKANAEKNLQNARALFESHLNDIFTKKGDGWVEKTIKEITSLLGDGLHGTPKYTDGGEYYFVNGNNLDNGTILYKESTKRVSVTEYEKYKKKLNDRTVLVSINGTLGNVAFYNNEKIILGKSACYFNLLESVNKHFIKYIISSPYFLGYAHREATGATIKNVSLKSMREFKVPLPSLTEQNAIVRKLDSLSKETQRLEAIYQQKIAALEALKKSLLDQAFTGAL